MVATSECPIRVAPDRNMFVRLGQFEAHKSAAAAGATAAAATATETTTRFGSSGTATLLSPGAMVAKSTGSPS